MKILKTTMLLLLTLTLTLFTTSCDTEVPESDVIPPEFSLKIVGDGFEHTFTQDDDFSSFQLNLREDAEYEITYTAGDAGGLRYMDMQYPTNNIEFETPIPSTWEERPTGITNVVRWNGNIAAPITGNIFIGTFRVNGNLASFDFGFSMGDYGGSSGISNITYGILFINSGNHTTEILEF